MASETKKRSKAKRDHSADNELSTLKDAEQQRTTFLTNPNENIAHTYSFDTAMPQSQKNLTKKNENNQSISSL